MILNVNGKDVAVDVEGDMPLLWILREELNYTGTKYGLKKSRLRTLPFFKLLAT